MLVTIVFIVNWELKLKPYVILVLSNGARTLLKKCSTKKDKEGRGRICASKLLLNLIVETSYPVVCVQLREARTILSVIENHFASSAK
jgi:hypothetical protein